MWMYVDAIVEFMVRYASPSSKDVSSSHSPISWRVNHHAALLTFCHMLVMKSTVPSPGSKATHLRSCSPRDAQPAPAVAATSHSPYTGGCDRTARTAAQSCWGGMRIRGQWGCSCGTDSGNMVRSVRCVIDWTVRVHAHVVHRGAGREGGRVENTIQEA